MGIVWPTNMSVSQALLLTCHFAGFDSVDHSVSRLSPSPASSLLPNIICNLISFFSLYPWVFCAPEFCLRNLSLGVWFCPGLALPFHSCTPSVEDFICMHGSSYHLFVDEFQVYFFVREHFPEPQE